MMYFVFYDYIDADGSGVNVIKSWLNGIGKPAKAFFNVIIGQLEASPPPRSKDSVWGEPYTKLMENKKGENWDGFIELRKTGSIQYRLIAKMQGRSVFLVACGVHKGQNYSTDVSPQTALKRVDQMMNIPAKYRREHEYD
jgi:hypothetical protein